jgi:hypothetical protein
MLAVNFAAVAGVFLYEATLLGWIVKLVPRVGIVRPF